jgi:uncharacterized protein (TIGR02466 family)
MKYTVTPLFAIPLYQSIVDDVDLHDIEFIKALEYERMPADNGDYTVSKNVLDISQLANLKSKIQKKIDHFVYEILDCDKTIKFEIQNSWVNRHGKLDFAGSHRHSNSLISGVFYLDVSPDSGAIIFQKDKSYYNLWSDTLEVGFNYQTHEDQSRLNVFNADAWGIYPKQNEIVLFPSLLYHSVSENLSGRVRYSLAFNVFPRGNLGGSINSIRI